MCKSPGTPSIYILQAGDNDFGVLFGTTAQGVFSDASAIAKVVKQAGCRAYIMTGFSKGGTDAVGTTFDTDKDLYDAVILSQWKEAGFDGVIDAGAILAMGCDGCNTNTTYFQSDQMHPTAAGQLLVAGAVSNRLNYDAGFNVDYPNYVSTASYTLAAGDGRGGGYCNSECGVDDAGLHGAERRSVSRSAIRSRHTR